MDVAVQKKIFKMTLIKFVDDTPKEKFYFNPLFLGLVLLACTAFTYAVFIISMQANM